MLSEWPGFEHCRKPPGWGRRHRLAILGFCGFALSYAMRFSLSIAIVAMVNNHVNKTLANSHDQVIFKSDVCPHDKTPHEIMDLKLNLLHHDDEQPILFIDDESFGNINRSSVNDGFQRKEVFHSENNSLPLYSSLLEEVHVAPSFKNDSSDSHSVEEQGEFHWNEAQQGIILGSFFWGYILTQVFGGWLSQRIGGKWPFGIGILLTGLFAILIPSAARLGGMNWLICMRILQGLAGGVTVPSMQFVISKWFPPEERGKLGSFTLAGMPFGTSMSLLCSGYLIQYFQWPSVFYVTGIMAVLWFLLWGYFAHASPFDDPTIDQAELRYIQSSLHKQYSFSLDGGRNPQKRPLENAKVPWCSVLFSLPFWSILICNTCETWFLYTINAELPTYMKTVLRFDIKQNSVMSAFPHLLTLLVSVILTNVGDNCIERRYLTIGTVRKLLTSIAMWGPAFALLGVAYSGCDRVKTVTLLAIAIGLNGGKFGGFLVNIIDIAPRYAGVLMGIINTIAAMPGFFAPGVAGMIINHNPSLENWRLVFLITAATAFIGNLFYILFSSGEEQSWNRINVSSKRNGGGGDNNASFDGKRYDGNIADKSFRRASLVSSIGSINQVITSNQNGKNNKEDAINGVYIIPMSPIIHLASSEEQQNSFRSNESDDQNHHHQYHHQAPPPLFPLACPVPIVAPAIDNFDGEGRGQLQEQEKDRMNEFR